MVHVVATQLSGLLTQVLGQEMQTPAQQPRYGLPADNGFADYLLRLEQLLAVQCAARDPEANGNFLFGEPEIVQGELNLALHLTAARCNSGR